MRSLTKLILSGAIALLFFHDKSSAQSEKASVSTGVAVAAARSEPVITVRGVCDERREKTPADAGACTTVITRDQFENLMQALHPGPDLPKNARNNLAKLYAEYLIVEAATRKAGMEDTAQFREFMNWMRALAATEYYRRKLQEKYSNPPAEEIDAFYQQHLTEYETVKLARVLIPRENSTARGSHEFDRRAQEAAQAAREDLVKGLDPTEVQREVYRELGLEEPPAVDIGKQRRRDLMVEQAAEVFSLAPGGVSQVETEPKSYVIYKVLSRETVPEENLKENISGQLTERKFKEAMKSLLDSAPVELNEAYFAAPTAVGSQPRRSPHTERQR